MQRLALFLSLAVALSAADAGAAKLRGGLLSNGGTPSAGSASAGKVLRGSAGQWAVGRSSGSAKAICHGYWCVGGVQILAVDDPPDLLPALALEFGRPTPNPAAGEVSLSFSLPAAADVDISVFDIVGRRVGALASSKFEAGRYVARWDGRDTGGALTGPGVYYARMLVDGRLVARRTFVMRR